MSKKAKKKTKVRVRKTPSAKILQDKPPPLFGEAVRQIMHHKGITGHKLAGLSGVPSSRIYGLINGQQDFPSFKTFFRMSKALGYPRPDHFLIEICNIIEYLHKSVGSRKKTESDA